jgi:putative PIN family toxin of toxin-antitoxin system
VLDTNVLVSALLARGTPPDQLYEAWHDGKFDLISCERQIDEFRRVTRQPFFRARIPRGEAGTMVNAIRERSRQFNRLPEVRRSSDPDDDWLLALCEASHASYLVTGDKSGLLALERQGTTRIVTPAEMVKVLG